MFREGGGKDQKENPPIDKEKKRRGGAEGGEDNRQSKVAPRKWDRKHIKTKGERGPIYDLLAYIWWVFVCVCVLDP